MLDEDESHAIIGQQSVEKLCASLKAARGRAYADDPKVVWSTRRRGREQTLVAGSRFARSGAGQSIFRHFRFTFVSKSSERSLSGQLSPSTCH
jgi:hypothetical protein